MTTKRYSREELAEWVELLPNPVLVTCEGRIWAANDAWLGLLDLARAQVLDRSFLDFVPAEDRTTVRTEPDAARLAALDEDEELWLRQLLDRLPDQLDLESTTSLIYGVPKLARGLGLDDAPTDQVKQDQKSFFRLLYNLLVDADRGPRLPTLFLALGADTVRSLLTPPA